MGESISARCRKHVVKGTASDTLLPYSKGYFVIHSMKPSRGIHVSVDAVETNKSLLKYQRISIRVVLRTMARQLTDIRQPGQQLNGKPQYPPKRYALQVWEEIGSGDAQGTDANEPRSFGRMIFSDKIL